MNVLLINGHPRRQSFSDSLANAYIEGARSAGAEIRQLILADLSFDPNVRHPTPHLQELEPDIAHAQQLIHWAHHVVFVYPTWWGTVPALLKGFLDRTLTSGYAFEEIEGGTGYAPLLKGRTAQLITTMDTPLPVYKLIYLAPGNNMMKKATLGFCGFQMGRTYNFGPVRDSTPARREKWLETTKRNGESLKAGALGSGKKIQLRIGAWLKAIRLQFYPMSFVAYAMGAEAAQSFGFRSSPTLFWLAYLWLFFLEVTTVLTNEYFDLRTDKENRYFGPFTGGSRVIVDGELSKKMVKTGFLISLFLSFVFLALTLSLIGPGQLLPCILAAALLFVLAIGYTVPPLKLCYRGLGELTVGLTHSFALVLWGWLTQLGDPASGFPWLLALPLFLSVLPSITLAGIPDLPADREAGKRTLAVRLGKKGATGMAIFFTLVAAFAVMVLHFTGMETTFRYLAIPVVLHAVYLCYRLKKYLDDPNPKPRIDGLMVLALSYILWFGIIPLVNLG